MIMQWPAAQDLHNSCEQVRTQKVQEDSATILSCSMGSKVNLLFPELCEELLAGAWQLDTNTLHSVAKFWADSLYNCNGAALIKVNLQISSCLDSNLSPCTPYTTTTASSAMC